MANPLKGEVALDWEGRKLLLVLDINALAELEDLLGQKMRELIPQLNDPTLNLVKAVLWAATREHAPDIDLKTAGKIIQSLGLPGAQDLILRALKASLPDAKAAEAGEASADPQMPTQDLGAGTGKSS